MYFDSKGSGNTLERERLSLDYMPSPTVRNKEAWTFYAKR